jgi:hypothetical protein
MKGYILQLNFRERKALERIVSTLLGGDFQLHEGNTLELDGELLTMLFTQPQAMRHPREVVLAQMPLPLPPEVSGG